MQLDRTAERGRQRPGRGSGPSDPTAFGQLARLAIPSGLGAQAPLIAEGSTRSRSPSRASARCRESADELDELSRRDRSTRFGARDPGAGRRARRTPAPLVHGPGRLRRASATTWSRAGRIAAAGAGLLAPRRGGGGRRLRAGRAAGARIRPGRSPGRWRAALPSSARCSPSTGWRSSGSSRGPPFPFDPGRFASALGAVARAFCLAAWRGRLVGSLARRARAPPPRRRAGAVVAAACALAWPRASALAAPAPWPRLLIVAARRAPSRSRRCVLGPPRRTLVGVARPGPRRAIMAGASARAGRPRPARRGARWSRWPVAARSPAPWRRVAPQGASVPTSNGRAGVCWMHSRVG